MQEICRWFRVELNHEEIDVLFHEYGDGKALRYQGFVEFLELAVSQQRHREVRTAVVAKFTAALRDKADESTSGPREMPNFRAVFEVISSWFTLLGHLLLVF